MNAAQPSLSPGQEKPIPLALPAPERTPLRLGVAVGSLVFAGLLIAYLVLYLRLPVSMPRLPWIYWLSTAAILVSGIALHRSVSAARRSDGERAHRALLIGTGLIYLFVGLQGAGVIMLSQMHLAFRAVSPTLFGLTLVMAGLHLLLAIGALAALSELSLRSERHHYEGGEARQLEPINSFCRALAIWWLAIFVVVMGFNLF
ncbi:MAG: hypothetical protein NZ561_02760 [Phycisphaerae bacterium]|nr:hypothetical protein [Phycisphaerae bacterium]MDW8262466.1 hypothetical protein [Phycisphaerales bacterium]